VPVYSVLSAIVINRLSDEVIKKAAIILVIVISVISIGYRAVANWKFVPVIIGKQSKQEFLDMHLEKQFGNNFFYLDNPLAK
jgi:hypothetical protein